MAKLSIEKIDVSYRHAMDQNLLCIINDRLVYLEPVTLSNNYICRIFVQFSLRCICFDALRASPTASHMGE